MPAKVLILVGDNGGCELWRTFLPTAELQRLGYRGIEWANYEDPELYKIAHLFDAVVLQRLHWEPEHRDYQDKFMQSLHKAGLAVIYEADDDLFTDGFVQRLINHHGYTYEYADQRRQSILHTLKNCDGMTVSTQRIATIARNYTDKPVKVVANYIDLRWFTKVLKTNQRDPKLTGLTIGWAGGNRPDSDVESMAKAWARIAERYPHVTFVIQGHHTKVFYDNVPNERIAMIDWLPVAGYPAGLLNIDIGCCPLGDMPFNRSKTYIKAMEYAVAGAAVVASPVVYGQLIEHGHDGFIAETTDDWEHYLSLLIEDYRLRHDMNKRLLSKVRQFHSLELNAWRWVDAWTEIVNDYRNRQRNRILLPNEVKYEHPQVRV